MLQEHIFAGFLRPFGGHPAWDEFVVQAEALGDEDVQRTLARWPDTLDQAKNGAPRVSSTTCEGSCGFESRKLEESWRRLVVSSRDVEFRLLQLVVSAVGDERVTIALVHWDGAQLRFAANPKRVPPGLGPGGDSVRVTLRALRQRFAREIRGQGLLDLGVELIHHGVPEGRGGLLYWSPLRRGRTQSSESHFRRLVDELDLRIPRETTPARESRSIGPLLSRLGEKLRASLASPDRVLVHNRVRGLREYDSPLSWQNHHWHHSFPLQLHREEPERIVLRVEAVLGRIDVSIPLDARAAVVAAHPESPRFADKLSEVAEFVSRTHGEKVRIVRAPIAKGQPPSTVELESWIRRDVG